MSKHTSIEIDDELLLQAKRALRTKSLEETVEKAFQEVVRRHLREKLARRIESGDGIDRSLDILEESRPPR